MHYFLYKGRDLYCEEVSIEEIAKNVGTPFYLYSHRTLERHFRAFDEPFSSVPHLVCFSVKSNSNIAVLKTFINLGGGVDIVSGGELYRALKSGVAPGKIVYSGVGKRVDEIEYAIKSNILMFNAESSQELKNINSVASRMNKKARVSLRVNPDVDPKTHPYISTGLKKNKFGIDIKKSFDEYKKTKKLKNLDVIGVGCHIGSQLTAVEPFVDAFKKVAELTKMLKNEGFNIRYVDLGGGLGIRYKDEYPPHPSIYAKSIIQEVEDLGCTLILEPGRVLVGNAGILVSKVLYTKGGADKGFVIVDAAMNDTIRPSLYGAYHEIIPVKKIKRKKVVVDVVGPICESGDFLAKDRMLIDVKPGELIAIMSSGAYGFTMSSNYNSRPRIPEIMVRENNFYVVRERESYRDLIRGESIPDFLL